MPDVLLFSPRIHGPTIHVWDKGVFKTLDRAFIKHLCFFFMIVSEAESSLRQQINTMSTPSTLKDFKKLVPLSTAVLYEICYKVCPF